MFCDQQIDFKVNSGRPTYPLPQRISTCATVEHTLVGKMSLSPVAIREANDHIQGLVSRVHELEGRVRELSASLKKQNETHAEHLAVLPLRLSQTMKQKNQEIDELKQQVAKLVQRDNERETLVQHLRNRCKVLDEISRHRDTFESILSCLDVLREPDYCSEQDQNSGLLHPGLARETDLLDDDDLEGSVGECEVSKYSSKISVLQDNEVYKMSPSHVQHIEEDVEPVHL